jgi:CYTH domain-containing protein
MAYEIERKFLIRNDDWRKLVTSSSLLTQGYLARENFNVVRIRIEETNVEQMAILCVKSKTTERGTPEFEYPVPLADGHELVGLCGTLVLTKRRHLIPYGKFTFEVDEFLGAHAPLILLEVEFATVGEHITMPSWVGQEVTADRRYTSGAIAEHGIPQ